jgi:hypothetical protein
MKKQRDLQVCIALIRAWLTQGGLESEQMDALIGVQKALRQLRRSPQLDKALVYQAVREITEKLVKAFTKHN